MLVKIVSLVILSLWLIGASGMLRAEKLIFKYAPVLFRQDYNQKKSIIDGPIYDLTQVAASLIPPKSSVYFLGPEERFSYLHLKARYYLYPITVKPFTTLKIDEMLKSEYLVVFLPDNAEYMNALAGLPFLELRSGKHENVLNPNTMAIYKINR